MQHLSEGAVGQPDIGQRLVEADNRAAIHLVVLPVPAVHPDDGRLAANLRQWQIRIDEHWYGVGFGAVTAELSGDTWTFTIPVWSNSLPASDIIVELYAQNQGADGEDLRVRACTDEAPDSHGFVIYKAVAPGSCQMDCYTPRIMPYHPGALQPGESTHIVWAR